MYESPNPYVHTNATDSPRPLLTTFSKAGEFSIDNVATGEGGPAQMTYLGELLRNLVGSLNACSILRDN
jgi:hypothetical protein